ncbi:MAG: enoyl-CoA hydratase [Frankiales bacterium]|nr:enoyl-CoA hydratase [Frankiales bacterium]
MSAALVEAGVKESVATLTINRPSRANALDHEITDALLDAVRALKGDARVRCLVLTGAGSSFSAGGDVATIQAMRADPGLRAKVLSAHTDLFWELLRLPFPSIAAVNGAAVGAGCTVALLCDLVVMAEDASLSDPRVALGLLDGAGGLVLWPLLTSLSAAREHLLLGDRVSAPEAHRLGLANRVVSPDELLEQVTALAQRLAALPPDAVQRVRSLLNEHVERAAAALPRCAEAELACFDSDEHADRVQRLRLRLQTKSDAG